MSLADVLHKIIDEIPGLSRPDELHAEVDAAAAPKPEPEAAPEPVTVADQRAAGIPPEKTVTVADQRAGIPAPDLPPDPDTPAPAFGTESDPHGTE